jgi:hypothetical protein
MSLSPSHRSITVIFGFIVTATVIVVHTVTAGLLSQMELFVDGYLHVTKIWSLCSRGRALR